MPSVAQLPVTPVGPVDDLTFIEHLSVSHNEPHLHSHPKSQSWRRRDAPLDPLLFAAAAASGPHVTRHHYHHDFFPSQLEPAGEEGWQWAGEAWQEKPPQYVSRQAPRSQRLKDRKVSSTTVTRSRRAPSLAGVPQSVPVCHETSADTGIDTRLLAVNLTPPAFDPSLVCAQVQCLSRARIPTPHGPAFLHLYRNNRDNKEHLAIVVDPAQLEDPSTHRAIPPIRSRSLDATWSPAETEMDRIVRGAYLGRLTSTTRTSSAESHTALDPSSRPSLPAPLLRIHSECFTGETIGSMRCDCGEQLDEALRLISLPVPVASGTVPGRGVIVYMRQEGRGIGLLSKLRAYNLQDMGHDTVTANLMLGHGADERRYEIAGAILQDLGMGHEGVRLLTNNPDKVHALQQEGVRIVDRVEMVPRSWQCHQYNHQHVEGGVHAASEVFAAGVTLIGAGPAHGEELDRYLRTKVERMGHMLTLPPSSAH